jgi:AraC family transcriptional regulator
MHRAASEEPGIRFHGVELEVRRFGGAKASRVLHAPHQTIDTHKHDWACITLPIIGAGREYYDGGEARIEGPSAILHPAGSDHGDDIGAAGLETFSIQFDPAWLRDGPELRTGPSRAWNGGGTALLATALARAWRDPALGEARLEAATCKFIRCAFGLSPARRPAWLERLQEETGRSDDFSTAQLAQELGLHPAWLARSYRRAMGEGLGDMRRRRRVATAVARLRESDEPLCDVAAAAGFCDQSHMNRNFSEVLGRTPLQVRQERSLFVMEPSESGQDC